MVHSLPKYTHLRARIENLFEALSRKNWKLELIELFTQEHDLIATTRFILWYDSGCRQVEDVCQQDVCLVANWKAQEENKIKLIFDFWSKVGPSTISSLPQAFLPSTLFFSAVWEGNSEEEVLRKFIGEEEELFDEIFADFKKRYNISG